MNSRAIELALKKQRLQIAGDRFAHRLRPSRDRLDARLRRRRYRGRRRAMGSRNREIVVAVAVALLIIRPRSIIGWARRGFVMWRLWRDFRDFLDRRLPPIRQR
jgi:hypothetical protein